MKNSRASLTTIALALLCALLFASAPAAETPEPADTAKFPFEPNEELVYEGEFTRAILRGINIAELRFTANRSPALSTSQPNGSAQPPLRFIAEAESKGLLLKLFGVSVHEHVESTVDPATFGVLQTTKLDEQGKRKRTSVAIFDKDQVTWTERDPNNPTAQPRVVTSKLSGTVEDIASVFYYLRMQPLAVGKSFEVVVSDSGRVYHIPVAVSEKTKMKTVIGEVQTVRVEPDAFGEGRLLRGKGKISIWFTDDARHVPVRAHITNDLGTLDIKLKSMNGGQATPR